MNLMETNLAVALSLLSLSNFAAADDPVPIEEIRQALYNSPAPACERIRDQYRTAYNEFRVELQPHVRRLQRAIAPLDQALLQLDARTSGINLETEGPHSSEYQQEVENLRARTLALLESSVEGQVGCPRRYRWNTEASTCVHRAFTGDTSDAEAVAAFITRRRAAPALDPIWEAFAEPTANERSASVCIELNVIGLDFHNLCIGYRALLNQEQPILVIESGYFGQQTQVNFEDEEADFASFFSARAAAIEDDEAIECMAASSSRTAD